METDYVGGWGDNMSRNDEIIVIKKGKYYMAYNNGCIDNDFDFDFDEHTPFAKETSKKMINQRINERIADSGDPEYGVNWMVR